MLSLLTTAVAVTLSTIAVATPTFVGPGHLIVTTYGTNSSVGCLNANGKWTASTCGLYTGTNVNEEEFMLRTNAGSCLLLGKGPKTRFGCVKGKGYDNWDVSTT